jgi:hypothetical protein
VKDREDEPTAGAEYSCDGGERGSEIINVGESEVTDDSVYLLTGERVG